MGGRVEEVLIETNLQGWTRCFPLCSWKFPCPSLVPLLPTDPLLICLIHQTDQRSLYKRPRSFILCLQFQAGHQNIVGASKYFLKNYMKKRMMGFIIYTLAPYSLGKRWYRHDLTGRSLKKSGQGYEQFLAEVPKNL